MHVVGIQMPVRIGDISYGGVSIESPEPFHRGTWHELHFTTASDKAVVIPAIVVHCRPLDEGGYVSGWKFLPAPFWERSVLLLLDAVSGLLSSGSLRPKPRKPPSNP